MKRFSHEIKDKALELYKEHKSVLTVSEMLGVHHTTISRWARKAKILQPKKGDYIDCLNCNKSVYRYPSRMSGSREVKYCSHTCQNEYAVKTGARKGEYNARWQGGAKLYKLSAYRTSAKKKGQEFKLEMTDVMKLWQQPCHYCGAEIETIGIDRVDNSGGYTIGNVVPCCSKCNYMKNSTSVNDFLEHVKKIFEFNCSKAKRTA